MGRKASLRSQSVHGAGLVVSKMISLDHSYSQLLTSRRSVEESQPLPIPSPIKIFGVINVMSYGIEPSHFFSREIIHQG